MEFVWSIFLIVLFAFYTAAALYAYWVHWRRSRAVEPPKPSGEPYKLRSYGVSHKITPEQLKEITDDQGRITVPGVTVVRLRDHDRRPA